MTTTTYDTIAARLADIKATTTPDDVAGLYESDGMITDLYDMDAIAARINHRVLRQLQGACGDTVTVDEDGYVHGDPDEWDTQTITDIVSDIWDDHDMPYDLIVYRDLDAAALRDILADDTTATGYGLWQVCDTAQHSTTLDPDTRDALKALMGGVLTDQDWQGAPTMDVDTVDTIRRTMLQLLSPAGAVIAPALDPSTGSMTTVVLAAAWVEDEGSLTYTLVDAITHTPLHNAGRVYQLVDDLEDADQTDPIAPAGEGDIDHANESERRFDEAVHELTGLHLGAYDTARGIQWLTRRAAL